jgi:hypothetical protein
MTAQAYPGPPLSPSRVGSDDPRCRAHPEEHRDMCRACARINVNVERERGRCACRAPTWHPMGPFCVACGGAL